MSFGERLKAAREEIDYTQSKLAGLIGYGNTTINGYESGANKPNLDIFVQICKIFDRDPNYFLQDDITDIAPKLNPEDQYIIDRYKSLTPHDKEIVDHIFKMKPEEPTIIYRFPVFRQEAAAGVGRFDISDAYSMEEFVVDNIPNEAVFVMKIAGDSMYDEKTGQIKNNAVVVINPRVTSYEDKIVIANLDGEIVCKRYSKVDEHIEFKSDNYLRQDENKDSRNYIEPKVVGVVLGVIENEKFIPVK